MDVFKLAEQAKERAKLLLQRDGKHCPMIICLTPKGQSIIPLTISSEEEKIKTLATVRNLMEKENVWAYITITEGWMVCGEKNRPIDLNIKPSQSPNSVKVLMISAVTRKRSKMWSIPVERNQDKIIFGKEKILDTQDGSKIGGLFFSLLSEPH